MEAEISQRYSTEFPNIKFHEELFSFPALLYAYRRMDRQSSFDRYSAECECATTCDTKSDIMAGQNWERVTDKKKACMHA